MDPALAIAANSISWIKREAIMQKTPANAPYVCHPSGRQGLAKLLNASGSICTKAVARITPVPTKSDSEIGVRK
jgi:hypothetical protein